MKVAMLVDNLAVSGGYQKTVLMLSQFFKKDKNKVDIYTLALDKGECYPNLINNFKIITPAIKVRNNIFLQFIGLIDLSLKIPKKVDYVLIHDSLTLLMLIWKKFQPKTRIVWYLNNQLSEDLQKSFDLKTTMRNRKIKLIKKISYLIKNKLYFVAFNKINVFAVYDKYNKHVIEKLVGNNCEIVYAGADVVKVKKHAKKINKNEINLLSIGVLYEYRRYEDAIYSVKKLNDLGYKVKLTILGKQDKTPNYFSKLEKLCKDNNLNDSVSFIPYLDEKAKSELYMKSDIFVFVNDANTWGQVVFEAVAYGLPVIVTNNVGAADIIIDKKSGWIVRPKKPEDIVESVIDIVKNENKLESMNQLGLSLLDKYASWKNFYRRIKALSTV